MLIRCISVRTMLTVHFSHFCRLSKHPKLDHEAEIEGKMRKTIIKKNMECTNTNSLFISILFVYTKMCLKTQPRRTNDTSDAMKKKTKKKEEEEAAPAKAATTIK